MLPGPLETVPDHLKLMLWGRDALLGFLLKGMKDIEDARQAHGVYSPVGVAVEIVDDFQRTLRPPNLFRALAAGCSPPSSASLIAWPITRRTSCGNSRRSSFDDPIHSTVFRRDIHSALDRTTAILVQASGPKSPMSRAASRPPPLSRPPRALSLPGSLNGRSSLTGGGAAGSVGAARGAALSQSTRVRPGSGGSRSGVAELADASHGLCDARVAWFLRRTSAA